MSVWIERVWVEGEVSVWTVNRFRKTYCESVFGSVIGLAELGVTWSELDRVRLSRSV